MLNLNKTILCGNLGDEPKLYNADPNKKPMLTGRIATNEYYKDSQGQKQKRTTWYDFVIFGARAEAFAQYMHKGSTVYLEGTLRDESFNSNLKAYPCYNADGTPVLNGNGQHFQAYIQVPRTQKKLYVDDWKFADNKPAANTAYPNGVATTAVAAAPTPATVANTFTPAPAAPATTPVAPVAQNNVAPVFAVNNMPTGV